MSRHLRVLALTHVFPRAADDPSAPFLLTWARALREAGVDLAVVAPHDAGLPARHDVDGVRVLRARYAPDRFERLAYRGEMHQIARTPAGPPLVAGLVGALARAVQAQVQAGQPDLVHVHWWLPGAIALRLANVDVPTMCTVHGTDVALAESRPRLAKLATWALAGMDRVEAVSHDLAERLERLTGRAADAVNPMPLDTRWVEGPVLPHPPDGDGLRVLAVGRLVAEKGFDDLIDALVRLGRPAHLTIVGDGPERDSLEAHAADCGVPVTFAGRLSPAELAAAYGRADVVAQPSHREGFGLVAAEALVQGVPVVATDSGGARDLLPASDLVPVGDVEALARQLKVVAGNLGAARAHAVAHGRRAAELLSPDAAAARTLAAYSALT